MISWKKAFKPHKGDPEQRLCRYFQTPCLKHGCHQYVEVKGKSPVDGERLDKWMCVDEAMLQLAFQHGMASKSNAAAVESLRNVIAKNDDRDFLLRREVAGHITKAISNGRPGTG